MSEDCEQYLQCRREDTYHVIGIFSVKSSAVKLPSVVSNKTFVTIMN